MNVRQLALSLLNEYEVGEKYVNLSLASHSADKLTREERASLTALLYTAVERKITYDYYVCALSGRSCESLDPYTRNILRLGMCQLVDMRSIPDYAAVNETVKLCRSPGERSFVNGVLRAAVRQKDSLPLPDEKKNYKRYLSVKYSFPLWIVKLLDEKFGREETERLLHIFNTEKYTDLTVNTVKTSAVAVAERLRAQGYTVEECADVPISLRIDRSVNPECLAGFCEGELFVQDRACVISAMALAPEKGDLVIDTCACPGGKSFAAAILMGDEGKILSFDLHDSKLPLITEGAARLGLRSVSAEVCDATAPRTELFGKADKVICDVPCSGLGVLGKKPDLRYKSEESVMALPELQLSILEASSRYLKVGGTILYSTCTLNSMENEAVVQRFLESHGDFELSPFSVGTLAAEDGMLTLAPHLHGTDGFFMAKIIRKQ